MLAKRLFKSVSMLALACFAGCCKRQVVTFPCVEKERPRLGWQVYEGGDCPSKYVCLTPEDADAIADEIESLRDAVR